MRKVVFIIIVLLVFITNRTYPQSFLDRLHFEASTGIGIKNKGITPLNLSFKTQLDIVKNYYAFFAIEDSKTLYQKENVKSYLNSENIGGGLGVKLLNADKNDYALDFRLKLLSSMGNADLKKTTFESCIALYITNNASQKFSPIIELGYRFMESHTTGIGNYSNVYMTLGLRY